MLRLSQNLSLQQRMAPQLIQSLQLLQMSTLELELEIKQQVQLTVDGVLLSESTGISKMGTVHVYHSPDGSRARDKGVLKITKTASTLSARPGDMIEFTIQFKNTGTENVGNVTVVDHLTSRLEYVEESQESSLGADFFVQQSVQEGTTVLRWEIIDPLGTGESGQVTFRCRVR